MGAQPVIESATVRTFCLRCGAGFDHPTGPEEQGVPPACVRCAVRGGSARPRVHPGWRKPAAAWARIEAAGS